MSVRYDITANDAQFSATMQRVRNNLRDTSATAQREGGMIEKYMSNIATAAGGIFSAMAVKQFVSQAAQIRGTFQQLEIAFSTMLQSEEKATALMKDVTEFAAKTPFDLQGVASGVKQLLAFGSASEEVIDEMRMLGDIAAGLSIPIGDLVYLYGTTRTQGRMFTMDLRQFMGRGIPLAEELAKQFGVTKDQVGQLVTDGKVGFEEMRKALVAMTSEGGKFGGLMDKSSKSISGQISNLEDSIDQMFNKIGESMEGAISGTLDFATKLVENYDKIGRALVELIALYGAYRVALVFARQAALGYSAAETLLYGKLLLAEKAQKMLNLTMLKNPYVLAGAALAGLVIGIGRLISANKEANIQAEATEHHAEMINARAEAQQKENEILEKHLSVLEDDNSSRNAQLDAMSYLVNKYPELMEKYKEEILDLQQIANLRKDINNAQTQSNYEEDAKRLEKLKKFQTAMSWAAGEDATTAWKWFQDAGGTIEEYNRYGGSRFEFDNKYGKRLNADIALAQEQVWNNQLEQWKAGFKDMKDKQLEDLLTYYETLESAVKNGEKKLSETEQSFVTKAIDSIIQEQGLRDALVKKKQAEAEEQARKAREEALKKTAKVEESLRKKIADAEYDNALANTKDEEDKLELQSARRIQLLQEEYEEQKKLFEMAGLDTTELEQSYARLIELEEQKKKIEKDELNLRKQKNESKWFNELAEIQEKYKTIEEQRFDIESQFERDILDLLASGDIAGADIAKEQMLKALAEFDINQSEWYIKLFKEVDEMTTKTLRKVIESANTYLTTDAAKQLSPEALKALKEQIEGLEEELFNRDMLPVNFDSNLRTIIKRAIEIQKLRKKDNKTKEEIESLQGLEEQQKKDVVGYGISSFISGLGEASAKLDEIAQKTDNINFKNAAEALKGIETTLNNVVQGFMQGGAIGVVVGMIQTFVSAISSMITDIIVKEELMKQAVIDFRHELELLNLTVKESEYTNLFGGEDKILKAKDAMEKTNEALNAYRKFIEDYGKDFQWSWVDATYYNQVDERGLWKGEYGLRNMKVGTGYNAKDFGEYDVWNEDGTLNIEKAEAFIKSYGDVLTETQREAIEQAIEYGKKWEENKEILKEIAEEYIGSLSTDLADVLWDSVLKGADAWEEFKRIGGDVIASLGKQMLQEMMLSKFLENYSDAFITAFGSGDFNNVTAVLNQLFADLPGFLENWENWTKQYQEKAEEAGFILDGTSQGSSGGGFETITQQQAHILDGRFTDIQIKMNSVIERLGHFSGMYNEMISIHLLNQQYLFRISENTKPIQRIATEISEIRKKTDLL